MINFAWRKMLGLLCFLMSLSLFIMIWLLNQQRAEYKKREIAIYQADVSHLTQTRKCTCAGLLVKMEHHIREGKNITEYMNIFNEYCFRIHLYPEHISVNELLNTFNTTNWEYVEYSIPLYKALHFIMGITDQARKKAIHKCLNALKENNLEKALKYIEEIPSYTLKDSCKKWKASLDQLLLTKKLIRRAGCKLFCDD